MARRVGQARSLRTQQRVWRALLLDDRSTPASRLYLVASSIARPCQRSTHELSPAGRLPTAGSERRYGA